jgi:hypothetical protein
MLQRCSNPRRRDYQYYGGRGITVCARWLNFSDFLSDMGEPPPGMTIDRIDPNGNYEPTNCRWATRKQQTANRRPFKQVGLRGERGPGAKLSASAIEQIRALRGGLPQRQIAQMFGVTQSNISSILTGKTWANDATPDPAPTPTALIARYGSEVLGLLGQSDRSALVAEKSGAAMEGGAS